MLVPKLAKLADGNKRAPQHRPNANQANFGNQMALRQVRSAGKNLDPGTRAWAEPLFGENFSHVLLHTDEQAARAATALQARAYTLGEDIVFNAGESPVSRHLLAHELAHVVQQRRGGPIPPIEGDPALERSAGQAAAAAVRGDPAPVAGASAVAIARQALPAAMYPPVPWLPEAVFEPPAAATPAGAIVALDAYLALDAAGQQKAFEISVPSGHLAASLHALDPALAQKPPYLVPVQDLLRRIEGQETRAEAGQTDVQMSATQAGYMKAQPAKQKGGDWGGAAPGKTRWEALTAAQQQDWTRRGNAAIAKMVAHAATAAPQLVLTAASFELNFEQVDSVSLGAFAIGGSKPGETVAVGFEFVSICEVNPAYALSTVEHELHGHPVFDAAGPSIGGQVYAGAAAQVPGASAGTQTFDYYPSEIYSLLREIPLWVATSAADTGKSAAVPGQPATIDSLNPDPRKLIAWHVREMQAKWAPSLLEPMLRGFWQRISADPGITPMARTAFAGVLAKVLGAADAGRITR